MIQAICSILTIFQVIDVVLTILTKQSRRKIQFSFVVWHLSLVMFALNGTSLWISLLHVINCAFIFSSLNKVKVVTIVGISDKLEESRDPYLEDLTKAISESISNRSAGETLKVFKLTLLEKKFFGLSKETKELEIPVSLKEEDEISFRKQIVGHTFDIIT
jgi:hypothetical protein